MATYSHSKLSTFEQCKYKYKLRYIDEIKPEVEKSIEAHLGTCVHDTLEWLYGEVLKKSIPTLDEALIHYTEKWTSENVQDFIIVKEFLTSQDYYNKGIQFLIDYYTEHNPFNDGTIELEKKVMISPAAVDVGGLIVTPMEKDFRTTDSTMIASIFREVSVPGETIQRIIESI